MALSGIRKPNAGGYDTAETDVDAACQTLSVFDSDLLSEAVAGSGLEHRQIGSGPFRGELRRRQIGGASLDSGRYSRSVQSRGTFAPGAAVIGCILEAQEAGCINGCRFGTHDVVVFPAGAEMDYLVPAETHWVAVQAPAQLLIGNGVSGESLDRVAVYPATSPAYSALADLLRRLVGTEGKDPRPAVGGNGESAATFDTLIGLIGRTLEKNDDRGVVRRQGLQKNMALVRRFESCLTDADPLHTRISDLVAELGVSQRTLEYVFQEHLGVSPKRYALLVRLNDIQRELHRASTDSATIADIARRYGIRNLGRFSADYRRQFGEMPSETLRRSRA